MTRRMMASILICLIFLVISLLAPGGFGAAPAGAVLTIEAVGLVDPAKIQEQFPAYQRLGELKQTYEEEMQKYREYLEGQMRSVQMELKRQQEAESEGKSSAEKKAIERKYADLFQEKIAETNAKIQTRLLELQKKLDAESAQADAKVKEIIAAISQEKGLAVVLNKTAVYYGGIDITADVIAMGQAKK